MRIFLPSWVDWKNFPLTIIAIKTIKYIENDIIYEISKSSFFLLNGCRQIFVRYIFAFYFYNRHFKEKHSFVKYILR